MKKGSWLIIGFLSLVLCYIAYLGHISNREKELNQAKQDSINNIVVVDTIKAVIATPTVAIVVDSIKTK